VAEVDGQEVARAVWWGDRPGGPPLMLDDLVSSHPDRVAIGAELLDAAHQAFGTRPEYHLLLPMGWEDDAERAADVAWQRAAAARAGLTEVLERLRYRWTPAVGVPAPSTRLVFRPEPSDGVFLDLFERARLPHDAPAQEQLDTYLSMPGERSWWRVALTSEGEVAGLAIPSRNADAFVVGFIGVVPEQRGHRYVDDLLAEITTALAAHGAEEIRADTDRGNTPMARGFERAGWEQFAIRLVLSAPAPAARARRL
jgi:ribosomal protein S18 acetylase RimI-like enzyme